MRIETVVKYSLIFIAMVVFFWAMSHAQAFLIPLTFAAFLAMLLVPVSRKLEHWGCSRTWSSLFSTLTIVIVAVGVLFLLSARASRFASDLPHLRQQIMQKYQTWRQTAQEQWGIALPAANNLLSGISPSSEASTAQAPASTAGASSSPRPGAPGGETGAAHQSRADTATSGQSSGVSHSVLSSVAGSLFDFVSGTLAVFGDMLLVLVYVFTLLLYRDKFREFLLRLTRHEEHPRVTSIITDAGKVAREYLWGRLLLIIALAVLYGTGFAIVGLQHTIFLAVFAAIFSIVPYIGNIIGITVPVLVALVSQGSTSVVFGVLAVFAVAQFFESYVLEPLIVGSEVDLNPLFTIIAVVAGGLLRGVPGLILGIPLLGVVRVIVDHIGPLQPYGYLIGYQHISSRSGKVSEKIKRLFGT